MAFEPNTDPNLDPSQGDPKEPVDILESKVVAKIFGNEKEVSVKELLDTYQKGEAASEKLRQVSEMEKNHRNAIQAYEDLRKAKDGDMDAMRRVFGTLGYEDSQVDEYFDALQEALAPEPQGDPARGAPARQAPQAAFDPQTDQDVKSFFKTAREMGLAPAELAKMLGYAVKNQGDQHLRTFTKQGLDKDDWFARIIRENKDADPDALAELVEAVMARRLNATGESVTESARDRAVQEVRAKISKIVGGSPQDPFLSVGDVGDPGMPDYRSDKPIKLPSITEGEDFDKKFLARIRQIHARSSIES